MGTKTTCGEFGLVNTRLQSSSKCHLLKEDEEDVEIVQNIRSAITEMLSQDQATTTKTVVILVSAGPVEV